MHQRVLENQKMNALELRMTHRLRSFNEICCNWNLQSDISDLRRYQPSIVDTWKQLEAVGGIGWVRQRHQIMASNN